MSFLHPAWLLGLLLVPVVWYLHRSGPVLRVHPVASLEPWRGVETAAQRPGARRRADPAWIRRAGVVALLALALAGPVLPRAAAPVTLWVDDSLSLSTLEDGVTRLALALAQAREALRATGTQDVEVRSLGRPWRATLGADAVSPASFDGAAAFVEPSLPEASSLDPAREHWLATDGADPRVNDWLASAPVARVFRAGESRRNAGIARLSVRPQPADADLLAVLVEVANGGDVAESRSLEVLGPGGTRLTRELTLEPGASAALRFELAAGSGRVVARLAPADALAADDVASIELDGLAPVAVAVDAACPASVERAVRAHPALRVAVGDGAGVAVSCDGSLSGPSTRPEVRLAPDEAADDAAFALRFAGLVDEALGERLLDRELHAGRGAPASRVVPLAVAEPRQAAAATARDLAGEPLSRALLWLALALLTWDAGVLARRLLRERSGVSGAAT